MSTARAHAGGRQPLVAWSGDGRSPDWVATGTILAVAEPASQAPASSTPVLWVPDPEKPSGWREFYLAVGKTGTAPSRIGFRRPGER